MNDIPIRTAAWQKSSFSNEAAACVELATLPDAVALRESDEPTAVITTTPTRLRELLNRVKSGSFEALDERAGEEAGGRAAGRSRAS